MQHAATPSNSFASRARASHLRSLLATVPLLTGRGIAVLLALALLGFGPAIRESDIIAAVLAAAGGVVLILAWLWCAISALTLKEQLQPKLTVSSKQASQDHRLHSNGEGLLLLRLGGAAIPPLTRLYSRIYFEDSATPAREHLLAGVVGERTLQEPFRFQHRGRYNHISLRCILVDAFGLSRVRWQLPLEAIADVHPPLQASDHIPILSSCQRAGDDILDLHQKQGDPYDLKPYNPADGARKIVWKLYAKRGELISRQPEPSLTPEGRTVIFCFGRAGDDSACGLAIDYVRRLRELRLDVSFGAEGLTQPVSARPTIEVNEAEEILLENVWSAERLRDGALKDALLAFVESVQSRYRESRLERVLIFTSPERFATEQRVLEAVDAITALESRGIRPVLCHPAKTVTTNAPRNSSLYERLTRWFVFSTERRTTAPSFWPSFLALAGGKRWERYGG